ANRILGARHDQGVQAAEAQPGHDRCAAEWINPGTRLRRYRPGLRPAARPHRGHPAGPDGSQGRREDLHAIPRPGRRTAQPTHRATVNQLMDRHLEMLSVEATTLDSYETFIRNHIRPLLGDLQLSRIDGQTLDSFYKQLRT